jgi:hypothetical protein
MQLHSFSARTLIALAGITFAAQSHAALNYDEGDLVMAFRATGGTGAATNYLLNLGSKAQFIGAAQIITLNAQLGNFKADLEALFTAGWQTRVDFFWSISGVHKSTVGVFAANTMFMTKSRGDTLASADVAGSTAWTAPSTFGAGSPAGKVLELGLRYELGNGGIQPTGSTESTNSLLALIQPEGVTQSYRSYMPGGLNTAQSTAFGFFGGASTIEGLTSLGLDLYTLTPGAGTGNYEGSFALSPTGTVTFTPVNVPEPSAFVAIGSGFVAFVTRRRRQLHR